MCQGDVIPCLHTSTMAKDLSAGKELPLRLLPGRIVALKSAKFDLTVPHDNDWASVNPRLDLDLCNIDNDIIFRITILRGTNKVFFNDYANQSLLDSWGQEKSVELCQVDVDKWQRSGVTISVHNCSTRSKHCWGWSLYSKKTGTIPSSERALSNIVRLNHLRQMLSRPPDKDRIFHSTIA